MTFEDALKVIHSLGYATKMPCYTYSISAWDCNRGGKLRDIPNSVCHKCYAIRGNFARPNIQKGLNARREAIDNPLWAEAMIVVLMTKEHSGHFRWFSSGDLQSLGMLLKICKVVNGTPHIKHWLPTREVNILRAFKRAGFTFPDNLTVRVSADLLETAPPATMLKKLGVVGSSVSKTHSTCPASQTNNHCTQCRACWDKNIPLITYPYH